MLRASSELGAASHTACGIYMRDDKFTTTSGIVHLHASVGTHWFYTEINFVSIHMAVHLHLT